MDNQSASAEPSNTGAIGTNEAAELFASLMDTSADAGAQQEKDPKEKEPAQAKDAPGATTEEPAASEDAAEMVEVDIDGFKISLPKDKAEKLDAERLMQADYTRKTMQAAEVRKTAEAETQKAQQERQTYAANLQKISAQLEGALQEQGKVDWESLLQNDPVEYLKQQHLAQVRQAQLARVQQESAKVAAIQQAEQQEAYATHIKAQQEQLLAKLPEWKDDVRAKADRTALREYLTDQGYETRDIDTIADARAVILARKAMLYDQMVVKASAAAKKVSTLPTKFERPGGGESQTLDRRGAAYQRLSKSGRVEDAAEVFASLL